MKKLLELELVDPCYKLSNMADGLAATGPHPFMRTKVRIGSCKGPVSYKSQQQVFHHDDVPTYARERKEEVNEWVSPNFHVLYMAILSHALAG
jgi:hypothetical protein